MAVSLVIPSNSGGSATGTGNGLTTYIGPGETKAVYRYNFTFTKASTHTAQTLVPLGVVTRPGTVKAVTAAWLEVNAANTTLATVQVLKRSAGAAAAGTALLSTAGTLTNNQTAQNWSVVSTAFTPALNTGSANVNPILSTTSGVTTLAAGDELTVTTTASSTQGTDLTITIEIEYTLNDEQPSSNILAGNSQ